MADGFEFPESNNGPSVTRKRRSSSPESESMACGEREGVNVGGPICPHMDRVSTDKFKSEDVEKANRKSDWT